MAEAHETLEQARRATAAEVPARASGEAPSAAPYAETDTLVIGAGPAGLAVGACLTRHGVPFRMLERAEAIGSSWRRHYDRLHLHTASRWSGLPYVPFPKEAGRYPARLDVVRYLEAYANRFGLRPDLGQEVVQARYTGGRWEVRTRPAARQAAAEGAEAEGGAGQAERLYRARRLVIATSYNQEPCVPTWPGQERFRGEMLHSSAYRNGDRWRGKDVLVVGIGNTGGEIALDLVERGARPAVVVRGGVHVVSREVLGVPAQAFGIVLRHLPLPVADLIGRVTSRLAFGDLKDAGLERPAIGPVTQVVRHGRIPLIDVGTIARMRTGDIEVRPAIARFEEEHVVFHDGGRRRFDAVILATGFRARLDRFLDRAADVIGERGYPVVHGREVERPGLSGLYFLGFANPLSGALREIGIEARRIARDIAGRQVWPRPAPPGGAGAGHGAGASGPAAGAPA